MSPEAAGGLEVDVLIIGGGIQGLYLARSLATRYGVCVVTDPGAPSETLDGHGYFSAGYEGNDAGRIQPARRAAGYWRLWAENEGLPADDPPRLGVVPPADAAVRSRLWADATLGAPAAPDDALPPVFAGGALDGAAVFELVDDVVIDPTTLVARLADGIEDRILHGEVARFAVPTERAIDHVEIDVGDGLVAVAADYVVLAANVGNGSLMHSLVARLRDHTKRKEAGEKVRACQAVRRRLTLAVRGSDLPRVAGHFDDLDITAHPFPGSSGEVVWLVSPPVDDTQTVLGPEEYRIDPSIDRGQVQAALDRLFAVAPGVQDRAAMYQWGVWVARSTEHPSMAVPDTSEVPQPAPAKLETLDLEGFTAIWPSHLAYAMITGDVVAERIAEDLGEPDAPAGGPTPAELGPAPGPDASRARWQRDDFRWVDWGEFAGTYEYKPA